MPRPDSITAALQPHPSTPCAVLDRIAVCIRPGPDRQLSLEYQFQGRIDAILWPAVGAPARTDGLWRHTCCEAFAGIAGEAAYREFNFAPSGQWAAYAFGAPRERAADPALDAPRIRLARQPDRLVLTALLPAGAMLPGRSDRPVQTVELGLSVVVEVVGGPLSYWALRHPAPVPDFHHRASFALTLDLSEERSA